MVPRGVSVMAYAVSRDLVDAYYRAYVSRDPARIGAMLHDNVEWLVAGPAEVMQVCGTWRGKAAVIERFVKLRQNPVQFKSLDVEDMLVDGDSSALFGRISSIHTPSGRLISHRVAQLVRYRDDKVVSMRIMNDTLDAAEQYVGHPIALTDDAPSLSDDLIAL